MDDKAKLLATIHNLENVAEERLQRVVRLTEENERYRKALENALGNVEREHHAWRSWHDEARAALAKREEQGHDEHWSGAVNDLRTALDKHGKPREEQG